MEICQDCRLNLILENNIRRIISVLTITYSKQWRIHHFTEWRATTPKVGVPTYYFAIFLPKIAWK